MSESQSKKLVKDFLREVEEKLPGWLKEKEDELKEVLNELEEHVYDKADELNSENPGLTTIQSVQLAITQMGTPNQIAREYKRRGTPKVYISEELWPTYLTVFKYLVVIVISISILVAIIGGITTFITGGDWAGAVLNGFSIIMPGVVGIFVVITLVFTYLSMEGYYLEDLKEMFRSEEEKKAYKELQVQIEMGLPPKPKEPELIKSPSELTAGGIVQLIIGFLFIIQPIGGFITLFQPLFLLLVKLGGFVIILEGILDLLNGLFAFWTYVTHKGFIIASAIASLLSIPIFIIFFMNPQIFPIIAWSQATGLIVHGIRTDYYWIYYLVTFLIIGGTIGGAIDQFYKASKFRVEDFYKK
ncbi:MAG: hypothetical protein EAX96_16695 [Candidatus Lokiarchaeota archaeon]|nr:hypothetical protein [Candidatus Lokiarchaeota archaeon]